MHTGVLCVNICVAIEKFDPSVGGAERYCWDFAHFLAERGHNVAVICMKAKDPLHPSIHIIEVMCMRFPQALRHVTFALKHYLTARSLPDHIHFCVGNTVYMDIYQPHGGLHRAWFVRETQRYTPAARKLIRLIKRLSLKDIVQRLMEWWTFAIAKPQVIAISKMVASDIMRFFSYPQDRVHLIPNGVDTRKYHPRNKISREEIRKRYGLDSDAYVFLFVAQNSRLKGYNLLLDACRMPSSHPFCVLVVGPYDTGMRRAAEDLGGRVVFAGRADDLHKIYPACDCLVHPSYYDSFSLVILEALASGIPVITTQATGAKMFVTDENGIVVPPGDTDALVDAMNSIYSMRENMRVESSGTRDQNIVFQEVEDLLIRYEKSDS